MAEDGIFGKADLVDTANLMNTGQGFEDVTRYRLSCSDGKGETAAIVVPSWGANIISFSYQKRDWAGPLSVLEEVGLAEIAERPTGYGVPILAPTPGRVGTNQSGRFEYNGKSYIAAPTRHGFLRNLTWAATDHSPTKIICAVDVGPDTYSTEPGAFPFRFRAEYLIELKPQVLSCRLTLRNTGEVTQPLSVGWHPYFHRSGQCRVRIPAGSRWELDDAPEPTPTGKLLAVSGEDDFRPGRLLADWEEHWDDIFTDLTTDQDGVVSCWVEAQEDLLKSSGSRVKAKIRRGVAVNALSAANGRQGIGNIQLFTPPGRRAISIEPLSAPPNALNLLARGHERADLCEVAPGQEVSFELGLSVEAEEL